MQPDRVVEVHVVPHLLVCLGIGLKLVSRQALVLEYPVKRLDAGILVRVSLIARQRPLTNRPSNGSGKAWPPVSISCCESTDLRFSFGIQLGRAATFPVNAY